MLLVWTITDPVKWVRKPIDDTGSGLNLVEPATFGTCTSEYYTLFLGIILGVNTIVSAIMLIQAYECRKISTDFSESLWISGAMCCIVQVWIIGFSLLKLLGDSPKGVFIVEFLVVFIANMSTLLLLFVPKILYLRKARREQTHKGGFKGFSSERRESITSRDNSHASDASHSENPSNLATVRMGNMKVTGLEPPAVSPNPSKPHRSKKRHQSSGMEGIRIIQSSTLHSEEVERLQKSIETAEARNKTLQDRLERLQEKMEQYIVTQHSNSANQGSFIIQARVSGTTSEGGSR